MDYVASPGSPTTGPNGNIAPRIRLVASRGARQQIPSRAENTQVVDAPVVILLEVPSQQELPLQEIYCIQSFLSVLP